MSAPLRIAIDATAVPPTPTGVGTYVVNLAKALADREDVSIRVFAAPGFARQLARSTHDTGARIDPVRLAGMGRPARIVWTQLRARGAARSAGARLLHGVHYELPLGRPRLPEVVTVHDLTFITHPEWHEPSKVAYFRWAMRRAVRVARRVLCVSLKTARDLHEHLGIDPDRIDVTPLGTDLFPASEEAVADIRRRLGITRPYLLALGTLEPRKDLPTLVRAFAAISGHVPHDLVLAGLPGWGAEALGRTVAESGVRGRVHLPGYIKEDDKVALLTGAEVFVYPSRYEGFGLPVLEAMACGAPIVTTTGGSLPEVAEDAAVLVEPGDARALGDAITRLLEDASLREEMRARGMARAKVLTWAACADLTVAAYRRALEA